MLNMTKEIIHAQKCSSTAPNILLPITLLYSFSTYSSHSKVPAQLPVSTLAPYKQLYPSKLFKKSAPAQNLHASLQLYFLYSTPPGLPPAQRPGTSACQTHRRQPAATSPPHGLPSRKATQYHKEAEKQSGPHTN